MDSFKSVSPSLGGEFKINIDGIYGLLSGTWKLLLQNCIVVCCQVNEGSCDFELFLKTSLHEVC